MSEKTTHDRSAWHMHAVGAAACLMLTMAAYFIGVSPLLRAHKQQLMYQVELENQQKVKSDLALTLSTLHREMGWMDEKLAQNSLRLQPPERINHRLAQLTELATKHGLEIDRIQPGEPVHATHYDIVPIRMTGKGTYRTHAAFVHDVNQNFADTGISSFKLTGNPNKAVATAAFELKLSWHTTPTAASAK